MKQTKKKDYGSKDTAFVGFVNKSPYGKASKKPEKGEANLETKNTIEFENELDRAVKNLTEKRMKGEVSKEVGKDKTVSNPLLPAGEGKRRMIGEEDSSSEDEEEVKRHMLAKKRAELESSRVVLTTELEKSQKKLIDTLQDKVFIVENEIKAIRKEKVELEQINRKLTGQVDQLSKERDGLIKDKLKLETKYKKLESYIQSNEKIYLSLKYMLQTPSFEKNSPVVRSPQQQTNPEKARDTGVEVVKSPSQPKIYLPQASNRNTGGGERAPPTNRLEKSNRGESSQNIGDGDKSQGKLSPGRTTPLEKSFNFFRKQSGLNT